MAGETRIAPSGGDVPRSSRVDWYVVELRVDAWSLAVEETAAGVIRRLTAHGRLFDRGRAFHPSETMSLDDLPCDLTLHAMPPSSEGPRSGDRDAAEDASWDPPPLAPIGRLALVDGGFRSRIDVRFGSVAELLERRRLGRALPFTLELSLPEVPTRRVGSRDVAVFGEDGIAVSKVEWRLDQIEPVGRSETRERFGAVGALERFVDGVRWESEGWRFGEAQFRRLVAELALSAVGKAAPSGQREVDEAVRGAHRIAAGLWDALVGAERETRKDRKERNAKPSSAHADPTAFPWYKRNLRFDFDLGLDSSRWCSIRRDALDGVIDDYLGSGLDGPLFEWICVDAIVYATAVDVGEAVKRRAPVSLRNPFGMHFGYFKAAGNLERMHGSPLRRFLIASTLATAVWLAAPAAMGGWLWSAGLVREALLAVAAWWALLLALPALGRRLGIGTHEFAEETRRSADLLLRMRAVYHDVSWETPPGVLLRALESVGRDVAWGGRAASLLVKADRRDPIRWVGRSAGVLHALEWTLEQAHRKRVDEGILMAIPELDPEALAAASAELWRTKP